MKFLGPKFEATKEGSYGDVLETNGVKGKAFTGTTANRTFFLPDVSFSLIDPTRQDESFFKALLVWICDNYPGVSNGTWIGYVTPNSRSQVIVNIYGTSDRDSTTGLPKYSRGQVVSFGGQYYSFGTNIFVWAWNNGQFYGNATSATYATSANQLAAARTIGISGGVTGTATSFDGTANISIPVTSMKEAYLTWGGKNVVGDVSPIDAACIDEFGHNKLAFLPAGCIKAEYTTDGGTSWVDYGLADWQKVALVTTTSVPVVIGKGTVSATAGTLTNENCGNYKARVTLCTRVYGQSSGVLYTLSRKILVNVNSIGARGMKILVETRTIANYNNNVDTWTTQGTYDVDGWSGWNSIPFNAYFGGSSAQTAQTAEVRLTLSISSVSTSSSSQAAIYDIRLIGVTNWATPSEMARAGHLYKFDTDKNAIFPASVRPDVNNSANLGDASYKWATVYATTFNGNATSATKLATSRTLWGQSFDGSGNVDGRLTINNSNVVIKEGLTGTTSSGYASGIYANGKNTGTTIHGGIGFMWSKTASDTTSDATLSFAYIGAGSTPWAYKSIRVSLTSVETDLPIVASSTLYVTGATTLGSTLSVTGAATLSSTLSVANAITLSGTTAAKRRIYFGDTSHYLELDATGFHFSHGVYSDSFVSAFGASSTEGDSDITADDIISLLNDYTGSGKIKSSVIEGGGGGGGGLSWTDLQNSSSGHIIDASHLPTNITVLPSKVTAVEGTLNSSRSAHYVYAAPSSGSGAPSWRALVASDIPTLTKSKISDFPTSLPASDVYAWAKASTKPSYTFSEIGSKPTTVSGYGITDAVTTSNVTSQSAGYLYGGTILEDLDDPEFSDSRMNYRKFNTSTLHRPDSSDNANGVINCSYGKHGSDGHYGFQLANITNKGRMYFRNWRQGTPSSWETIAFLSDIPSTMALSSITGADDLKAIEALTGTSGFLKKTAANTWTLDTTNYLTGETASNMFEQKLTSSHRVTLNLIDGGTTAGFIKTNASGTLSVDTTSYATSSALSTANGKITTLEGYFTDGKANDAAHADSATNSDKVDGYHVATMPGVATALADGTMLAMRSQTIDLSDTSVYSASSYYPVTFPNSRSCGLGHVKISHTTTPYQYIDFLVRGASYYGTSDKVIVRELTRWTAVDWLFGSIGVGSSSSALCCIWLRGGQEYKVIADATLTAHASNYTSGNCIYTVGTNPYGGSNTNVTILFTAGLGSGQEGFGPSAKANAFYMSGAVRINGGIYTNGTLNSVGNCVVGGELRVTGNMIGYYSSSDIRLKKDLTTLSLDGDKIASLPLYSYKRTDRNNKQTDGTIAQEVQKLLPNEVYDRGDGYLAMAEGQLGLIFSINAHKEIMKLRGRIEELERQLRQ